jgi:hydroxymethylpyrimidine pyrophosphatase-like HAD family hydrolase
MRYLALATDYDGTLAHDGIVDDSTVGALDRLRASGRKLIMVTGRELDDLERTFAHLDKFDRVVAENGALIYDPATRKETPIAEPPPRELMERLRAQGASPLSSGRVIVATREPWEKAALETIRELGLELQVIFNKGAVMVLPSGINKATGLKCALEQLNLSAHNIVGIGDAENDHAFLSACECAVAVANALPALKEHADFTTQGARGAGVTELIDLLLGDDLASLGERVQRHNIHLGEATGGGPACLPVYGATALVAGSSGGGKSTLTTGVMERLAAADYQFCAVDPEGDYQRFPNSVIIGDPKAAPLLDEVKSVLEKPGRSAIVNMVGVPFDDRPTFFERVVQMIGELRKALGHPHWIIIDEAHHLLPASERESVPPPDNSFMITLAPDRLHKAALERVTHLVVVGERPAETMDSFCRGCGCECPERPEEPLERGEAILWARGRDEAPLRFRVAEAETPQVRHSRKYAAAELTPDRSFYFRGPAGKLNLRAQNLMTFLQLLEGIDDETWQYHLDRGEYSEWFRENIKNDDLADEAARIEKGGMSAGESREAIRNAIEQRYTLPA